MNIPSDYSSSKQSSSLRLKVSSTKGAAIAKQKPAISIVLSIFDLGIDCEINVVVLSHSVFGVCQYAARVTKTQQKTLITCIFETHSWESVTQLHYFKVSQ